jgi:uncharacterized membrane protein YcjF (UPF0283 family)
VEHGPIVAAARRLRGSLAIVVVRMNRRPRRSFWIETALAMLSSVLFVLTFSVPDWIEAAFRIDPDAQSGSLEAAIVSAFVVTTLVSSVLAHHEWRRTAPSASAGEVT